MFSKYDPDNDIPDTGLQKYEGRIEINKVVEVGNCRVHYSPDYSFQTPDEILKILNNNTSLWVDKRNNLLGFSNNEKSLIIPLRDVKGFEIQNVLKGKGPGESYFSVCLPNSKYLILSIASYTYNFDTYAAKISGALGVKVTFAPEFYNC
ncbi:hypothetical protein SRABI04_00321 [Chryseobacterium sp. Bi04]|nr:hypothetical protein SRABI04_00321 [Chryseobacterium sp. Bi04]